jgi:hypothetical protein
VYFGYHSAWWSQSPYPQLAPGQTASVNIQFQNTGCNTWGSNVRIGTWNPIPGQDQSSNLGGASGCPVVTDWSACNRVAPSNGSSFAYGQIAIFTFTVKAPASLGTYKVYFRPLIEGVTWMEDQGVFMQVSTLICTSRNTHDNTARYAATTGGVTGITGISSSILEYDPYYTGFNATGTNASIMLTLNDISKWAQLGWMKSKIDGGVVRREVFLERFFSSSDNTFQFWPAKPLDTSTWYEILWTSPSTWDFFVGGTFYSRLTKTFTPQLYEVFGETHDAVDQMPGGVNKHVTFVNRQYFPGPVFVTSSIFTNPPYAVSNPSTARYEIWDTACAN